MKITVTGGAGYVGSNVVRALVAAGHEVTATDALFSKDLPVRVEVLDLLDRLGVYRVLEGREAVIHLGNHTWVTPRGPQRTYAENAAMTANVFQAAAEVGVKKIIYASSVHAMAGHRPMPGGPVEGGRAVAPVGLARSGLPYLPADGQVAAHPGNLYGASKAAGEALLAYFAEVHGIAGAAVRLPGVIRGPVLTGQQYKMGWLSLDECFAYLHMEDAVELFMATVRAELKGFRVYFPSSLGTLLARPAEEVVREFYAGVPLRRELKGGDSLVDVGEITRETGWAPGFRLHEGGSSQ